VSPPAVEDRLRKGEVGAHRRLAGRQRTGVRPETERPVGAFQPAGQPIGKDRHDLAADDADPAPGRREERLGEARQPVASHEDVIVHEDHDLAPRLGDGAVATVVQPLPGLEDVARGRPRRRERCHHLHRVVGGVVVDDQQFPFARGHVLARQARQGLPQETGPVEGDDGDGDAHFGR
jgi:hypothetical protein